VLSLRALEYMLRVSFPSPNTSLKIPPQIASSMTIAPQKKASSQSAAAFTAYKGKKMAIGGTGDADHHSQNPNIVLH